ncbi:hypothetical protein FRB90_000473 [Tulasnella sp. 427]|nr:hypothetical protein FRB90_000473 [Tulasnella sp. 427]
MSHSLAQQVSDLRRQLAEQMAECIAIRAECEQWKARAERESQEKANLEALLKDAEKGKIEWWTKFKQLESTGLSDRKRKCHSDEEEQSDNDASSDYESGIGQDTPPGMPNAAAHTYQATLVDADVDLRLGGPGVVAFDSNHTFPTPPNNLVKVEEEELSLQAQAPILVKIEDGEGDDQDVQYVSGTFPTTLGDIRIKSESGFLVLPSDFVQERLRRANANSLGIVVEPEFHAQGVTRAFLSSKFGGNPNHTLCPIAEATRRKKGHDLETYFCPNISWSPNLPRAPGLPGLSNVSREDASIKKMPMFVGLNVNKWVYMGHYIGEPQGPLTQEEINGIGAKALNAWVLDMMKKEWAKPIRASVYLRLKGLEPTALEIEKVLKNSNALSQVTASDIRAAYEQMEEVRGLVRAGSSPATS